MSSDYNIIKLHEGKVVDDEAISLMQLSRICHLPPAFVVELVDEGILEPDGESASNWRFSFSVVERVKTVARFQHDLDVNLAGAALALELLDRIETLRAQLKQQ
ncbi:MULTISPECIES: chaperone modulator CbpM [unclassified Lentimonas]|uniref:chaperone modulator CbpM n=1 Tax=unclassified Lentimonas TaxID=2630993 RepID=UPI001328A1FB|nr:MULTISPECIES: chaperone modulator CbpM [unclassified Lentimonas]CAA6676930.1 Unannotated [Lentimonas sp. CC4]CAA6686736.1 Unannotated [Lentimonas sp. CC6]CAA6692881.1 Unannotated [Lentimonas sp. CC10]CAA6695572.1 Unannotated [Lentimonas sp. CC19]CAA7069903.1 Unannotated [Lentimonas sp. CC11]